MTNTAPLWPSPAPRPGMYIRHTYRCPRTNPTTEATRRTPDGVIIAVQECSGCGGTDYVWRMERQRWQADHTDDGGDAA